MPFKFFSDNPASYACPHCNGSTNFEKINIDSFYKLVDHPDEPNKLKITSKPVFYGGTYRRLRDNYRHFGNVFSMSEQKLLTNANSCQFYETKTNIESRRIIAAARAYQYAFIAQQASQYAIWHTTCLLQSLIDTDSIQNSQSLLLFFFIPLSFSCPKIKAYQLPKKLMAPAAAITHTDFVIQQLTSTSLRYKNIILQSPFLKHYKFLQQTNLDSCIKALQLWGETHNIDFLYREKNETDGILVSISNPVLPQYYIEPNLHELSETQTEHNKIIANLINQFAMQKPQPEIGLIHFFSGFFALPLPTFDDATNQIEVVAVMSRFCHVQTLLHNLALNLAKINPNLKTYEVGTSIFMRRNADDVDLMLPTQNLHLGFVYDQLPVEFGRIKYQLVQDSIVNSAAYEKVKRTTVTFRAVKNITLPAIDIAIYGSGFDFEENMAGRHINVAAVSHDLLTGSVYIYPAGVESLINNTVEFLEPEFLKPSYPNLTLGFKCFFKIEAPYEAGAHLKKLVDDHVLSTPYRQLYFGINLLNHTKSKAQLFLRYHYAIYEPLQALGIQPLFLNFDCLIPSPLMGYVLLILSSRRVLELVPQIFTTDETLQQILSFVIESLQQQSSKCQPGELGIKLLMECRSYLRALI